MASSENNHPEEGPGPGVRDASQAETDPLDSGIANSQTSVSTSDKEDQMDWEPSERKGVLTSQGSHSSPQNRSEELKSLDVHLDWMTDFMDKVKTGIKSFQTSNGTMDISELFENIDQLLGEGATLKDNTYRLWIPPDTKMLEPSNRVNATKINPRPETLTFPSQNNNAESSQQQGATGPKQPNSETSFMNRDDSSTALPLPQASNESTHTQETELDPLQRKGEFVTNLKSFKSSMEDSSSSLSTPHNHQHLTSRTTRLTDTNVPVTSSRTESPTYQGAPYIHGTMEDLSFAAEDTCMYREEPATTSAVAVATMSAGQSAGNQGTQPQPSTFTSPSFQGSTCIPQSPLQNWTGKSPWGKVPLWDIRNTRYNKGTSFKLAQGLFSFSRSVGVIVKNNHLWGTCSRYGQRHIMTSDHVASPDYADLDDPSNAFVEFNYYDEWPPQRTERFSIQCIDYKCCGSLDFCLLRLNIPDNILRNVQRDHPGLGHYLPPVMVPLRRKVEMVTLVGHPQGLPKGFDSNCPVLDWYQSAHYADQVGNNEETSSVFNADRINYRSTFWGGSSGSPVVAIFDDSLQIVAMHTQGYPTGQPCELEQGVKMSAIRAEVKTYRPDLYHELFT